MYGCQQSAGRETGGCVELSPNVWKSVELRAMEVSKVKRKKKGGCVEVSLSVSRETKQLPVSAYVGSSKNVKDLKLRAIQA